MAQMMAATGKRQATPLDTLPPILGCAMLNSVLVYPVDVVRAQCMANPGMAPSAALQGFLQAHGLAGFLRQGLVAEVLRASTSRTMKFFLQPVAHQYAFGKAEAQGTPVTKGMAGALATVPEVLAISPLENLKLASQLDKEGRFRGTLDVARHLVRSRGVFGGLYIGYFGMQCRQCLWTGTFFLSLDAVRERLRSTGLSQPLVVDVLGGFLAGACGTSMNCWTDVCRSVLQKKAVATTFDSTAARPSALEPLKPGPFFRQAVAILQAKGITGLYAGVVPKMVQQGGGGAIMAVLLPRLKSLWFELKGLQ